MGEWRASMATTVRSLGRVEFVPSEPKPSNAPLVDVTDSDSD